MFLVGACATAPKAGAGDTIDVVDAQGRTGTLDGMRGKVVVVDVCASWAAACNLNARVLDEAVAAFAGKPVELVTVLVDEDPAMASHALAAYRDVLGVTKHAVVLAGPHVKAGTSALGDPSYVPRIVILDATGAVRFDDSGGVVSITGLVDKVTPLLPK